MIFYQDSSVQIYHQDCVQFLNSIPDDSVDFILADYPFNWQSDDIPEEFLRNFDTKKEQQKEAFLAMVNATAFHFGRILKPDRNLFIVNNPHNIFLSAHFYHEYFTLINGVALIRKGSIRPAFHFGFQHNYALVLQKGNGRERWNGARKNHDKTFFTDVIEYQNGYRGKGKNWHPQALPLDLTKRLVETFSHPGDIVVDPFLGSGSTAVACAQTGRVCYTSDIKEEYCQMAADRIKEVHEKRMLE